MSAITNSEKYKFHLNMAALEEFNRRQYIQKLIAGFPPEAEADEEAVKQYVLEQLVNQLLEVKRVFGSIEAAREIQNAMRKYLHLL